ncbi:hypothetical protein V6O07_17380, partial [Arthrospira platensis SPKY2]
MRSGPGTNFDIIGALEANTPVDPTGQDESGEWLLLADESWIFAGLVSNVPAGLPVVDTPAAAADADGDTGGDASDAADDGE